VKLDTRAIALTIVFTALAIALTPVAVPAVFLVATFYRFWEIPIVTAFLLDPKIGVTVAILRTLGELTLFPGPAGVLGPPIALGGTLSMLLGLYVAIRMFRRKSLYYEDQKFGVKLATYLTLLGGLFRMAIVPFIMYPVWRFLFPHPFSDAQILALIPPLMVFAFTLCLYTIPVGYLIAKIVNKSLAVRGTPGEKGTQTIS
jgi:hypothetical protein